MEVYSEKTVRVHLKMNEKEAKWLKAYMQNFMGTEEGKRERQMREDLFGYLRDELGDF